MEVGGWRLEVGGWRLRLEVGGWRLGGWRVGGWRLEVGVSLRGVERRHQMPGELRRRVVYVVERECLELALIADQKPEPSTSRYGVAKNPFFARYSHITCSFKGFFEVFPATSSDTCAVRGEPSEDLAERLEHRAPNAADRGHVPDRLVARRTPWRFLCRVAQSGASQSPSRRPARERLGDDVSDVRALCARWATRVGPENDRRPGRIRLRTSV
jgi:hypothetical protein